MNSRRQFIKASGTLSASVLLNNVTNPESANLEFFSSKVPLYGHLWVYASRYPPNWDCTPILDEVFSDLKYAGLQGVELMEIILRNEGSVTRLKELVQKHSLPVVGTSYNADMWVKSKHSEILEDIELVLERLHGVGGTMLGITVGDAKHKKTEEELDAQGEILKKIIVVCKKNSVQANLHNHTFEVVDNLHDLKGTIARVPELPLGPDLNWLVRGGVDPVQFIKTYGHKMVFMHIRDQDASGKWTEAVGEGVMDFPAIAKALTNIHYKGKAAIELAFDKPAINPVREDWKKSRQYVKGVFGW
ncbi:sugar phosphate isomerase/epimerase [Segetibacter sp.]|jgi:sugar phosphate isomerase/epimerase|uniref:sugar phosphate isomerase/epimerase family protein n=1 Tax=Segetibacter sp. TaxID=2231182 RepID=UPI00261EC9C3|nr:sugar phosphate isomerase/epimerase [Segetibacter sp.]MCW3080720.1 sugar phosphate isomerase/epimerase [Segetibacter sp.]